MNTQDRQAKALIRATTGQSWSNYPAIISGFAKRGIAENEIKPRENIFTYDAWRALGRQVRRGEHGVRVCTFIKGTKKEKQLDGTQKEVYFSKPWYTTVFHITQTDVIAEKKAS